LATGNLPDARNAGRCHSARHRPGGSKGRQAAARGGLRTVTFCVGSDEAGNVVTYNGSKWTLDNGVDPRGGWSIEPRGGDISCPTTTFCVLVDPDGNEVTWNGTTWRTPVLADDNLAGSSTGTLTDVSCPTPTFCAATDSDGT
jgi:hypothetical protein